MNTPVEIYTFETHAGPLRYTSAAEPLTLSGLLFAPAVIRCGSSAVRQEDSQIAQSAALRIEVDRTHPVALLHREWPPDAPVAVTVGRVERAATVLEQVHGWWSGVVSGVRWEGALAIIECDTVLRGADRPGPRMRFQQPCRWALYSRGCGVDPNGYAVEGTISEVNPLWREVYVDVPQPFVNHYFRGGWIETANRRTMITINAGTAIIEGQYNTVLIVAQWSSALSVGASVTLFPGCNHQPGDCDGKFDNIENYGGLPSLPDVNPFDGMQ